MARAVWPSAQRLDTLSGPGAIPELLVESFTCTDAVSELFELQLDLLSLNAHLDLDALLRQPLTLHTVLADGIRSSRSGIVMEASSRDANGGFAAYRLLVQPFLALLQHSGQPRSWQDKTLPQIVDEVLQPFAGAGAWQWGEVDEHGGSEHLDGFFARGPHRGVYPFCLQYRATDFAFIQRLLCFAGMGWRMAEDPASPSGHRIVFFADSYRWPENPSSRGREGRGKPSAPSARGPGIRFQRAAAVEEQDSVQAWVALRALQPGAAATLHWDARAKRSVAASVATHVSPTGPALAGRLDWLEVYEAGSAEIATGQPIGWNEAQQGARLLQEGFEARNKTWLIRRCLRTSPWTCAASPRSRSPR